MPMDIDCGLLLLLLLNALERRRCSMQVMSSTTLEKQSGRSPTSVRVTVLRAVILPSYRCVWYFSITLEPSAST